MVWGGVKGYMPMTFVKYKQGAVPSGLTLTKIQLGSFLLLLSLLDKNCGAENGNSCRLPQSGSGVFRVSLLASIQWSQNVFTIYSGLVFIAID